MSGLYSSVLKHSFVYNYIKWSEYPKIMTLCVHFQTLMCGTYFLNLNADYQMLLFLIIIEQSFFPSESMHLHIQQNYVSCKIFLCVFVLVKKMKCVARPSLGLEGL